MTRPPAQAFPSAAAAFARGVALFEDGFVWEAHEAWEYAWVEEGRAGEAATLLKGLIKLAAARVKLAQDRPVGVRSHAEGALRCLAEVGFVPRYPVDRESARALARALLEGEPLPPLNLEKCDSV